MEQASAVLSCTFGRNLRLVPTPDTGRMLRQAAIVACPAMRKGTEGHVADPSRRCSPGEEACWQPTSPPVRSQFVETRASRAHDRQALDILIEAERRFSPKKY